MARRRWHLPAVPKPLLPLPLLSSSHCHSPSLISKRFQNQTNFGFRHGLLGDKYTAFRDSLAELAFAELSGGDEPETFIPTRSAIAVSGDPTVPITEADIAGSPFDRVYFHEEDTNHIAMTTEASRWICKEVNDLIQRPFLSRVSPSKRPVAGTEFTMTVTGGNFDPSSVVTWNYQGKTDLDTTFVDGGTLEAFVPDDLIAELTECIDENGCQPPGALILALGERENVRIWVENREALPFQTTSPDWEPTEALRCDQSRPFQIEEVSLPTFTPEQPTSVDVIEAVFAQDWRDGCVPRDPQVEVQGDRILVTATNESEFCFFVVSPYTLNFSFGPLPAGDYTLEVRDVRTSFDRETVTPLATRVFSVRNPTPVAHSLVPDTAPAGSADLDLRIIGEGFVTGESTAHWNGDPLLTTVESPNEIAAIVPAGRLGDQGSAEVIVRTNDPNQELASDPLAFTIGPPELTLERLEPESVSADSPDTTITLIGAGFGATTSVEWTRPGGSSSGLHATIVDAQHLTVTLPASELRLPATHLFLVRRDADSSDSLGFMVTSASEPTNIIPVVDSAVNAGSFSGPVAPGALASLFGSALAPGEARAASFPLSVELLGTRVLVNGVEAPLLYVSANQINFQVPFGTALGDASFAILRDGEAGPSASHAVAGSAFGAFQYQREAPGLDPIVTHADGSLVTPGSPAQLGETVVLFGTGVRTLTNLPPSGHPSPSEPLAVCAETPRAFLSGGQFSEEASVAFCGLTPGFAGLVQINIRLPENRPPGTESNLGVLFPGGEIQTWPLPVAE